jgi:hypothetical protein
MHRPLRNLEVPTWAHVILLLGVVILWSAPCVAWEFSLKGEYEYRFRWFGRMGERDLFGRAQLQELQPAFGATVAPATVGVGFAGPNIWLTGAVPTTTGFSATTAGVQITRGGFSTWGSDAYYNDSRLTLSPAFKVNEAVRVHGVYTVGGYRHKWVQSLAPTGVTGGVPPLERYYMSQTSMNAYDTASLISVEQFRATLRIPWGILSVGVKDFPLGTGATFGYNTRAEFVLLVVPYGPFRFLPAIWLGRNAGLPGSLEGGLTVPDGSRKSGVFSGLVTTYTSGNFDAGAGVVYRLYHGTQGVEGINLDLDQLVQIAYFKYSNGRFFANAEYAWLNANLHFLGAAPVYQEGYHAFAEAGTVMGPAKFTFMYAQSSGPVLNNDNPTKAYVPWPVNYQALEPYEWLMFRTYAGGNNSYNGIFVDDGTGMMGDAYAFAGRVDYAVASNLNLWGSYIWAHRLEAAGYLAGGNAAAANLGSATPAGAAFKGLYGGTNPYVEDGFIGWEANLGVNWKLLEGFTFNARYAYWAPGRWFDWAYQTVGMRGGALVNDAYTEGRDPIQAFEGGMVIDF